MYMKGNGLNRFSCIRKLALMAIGVAFLSGAALGQSCLTSDEVEAATAGPEAPAEPAPPPRLS